MIETRSPGELDISIIIPARDEEENLSRLLRSIDGQTLKPAEVIVVDDHSTDGTAHIAEDSGCVVLSSPPLPEGWTGKPWACWNGSRHAKGEILVFLDADTYLEPNGLAKMAQTYAESGGLVSIQPFHRMEKPYERLSAIFNIIIMAGMNAFTPLQSRLKPMGAFGPCNICSREDYFAVGGHREAKGQILESLDLGKQFLRAMKNVRCYGGKGAVAFRMYPDGLRSLIDGFSKGFGTGAQSTSPLILIMIVAWIAGGAGLTRHLLQASILGDPSAVLLFIGFDALYVVQIHWMLSRIGNFGLLTALVFQIPLLFFVLVFTLSLLRIFFVKRVRWKGRVISTGAKGDETK